MKIRLIRMCKVIWDEEKTRQEMMQKVFGQEILVEMLPHLRRQGFKLQCLVQGCFNTWLGIRGTSNLQPWSSQTAADLCLKSHSVVDLL